MSEFTVDEVKRSLRVYHNSDDVLLGELLDEAEDEALQYLEQTAFPMEPTDESPGYIVPRSIRGAVFLLVQARYDETDVSKVALYRERAETMLFPFRCHLGA